ncbi:hypothetical protein GWI33_017530 [Rhynchophorus ferrugineus]|uniref:Uncharacterized protein n=1 Tax=Rhynchophorus ferrugineus TaxID=354439 RepID=A0A834M2C1_RHYFE|nr:hypothetical protein GWI33_017530 [Rhynchophorus ferrugineus]
MTMNTVSRLALIAALVICQCTDGQLNSGYSSDGGSSIHDLKEIQRQNQITKQILQGYLEKRLYGKRLSRTPSLQEILPSNRVATPPPNNIHSLLSNNTDENDSRETLEGEETMRDDTYYEDLEEVPVEGNYGYIN